MMSANSEAAHDVNWAAPAERDSVAVKYGVICVKFPIDVTHCPPEVSPTPLWHSIQGLGATPPESNASSSGVGDTPQRGLRP